MQLFFIRHAQSMNNKLWDETGGTIGRSEDPGLTEKGCKQTHLLAGYLAGGNTGNKNGDPPDENEGFGLTHLYTSLMLRAVETGIVISKRIGIPLEGWIDLHEGGGVYAEDPETGERQGRPGCSRSDLKQKFPDLILPVGATESGWWMKDFEPWGDRLPRAARLIEDLLQKHNDTDDRVALISHGGFYNAFLFSLLGMASDSKIWFALNNTAITRIDFSPESTDVIYLNRMEFLPPNIIT
jgi:2,3-bisphosphoglycerate-dependent phosphoglycerate mutase